MARLVIAAAIAAAIAATVVGTIVNMLGLLVALLNKLVDAAIILGLAGIAAAVIITSLREIHGHRLDMRNAQVRRERLVVMPATITRPVHQPVEHYQPTFTVTPTPLHHIRRELTR
jgi:hypothetical protein